MPLIALTRAVPESLDQCELTHVERVPVDLGRARAQHAAYERALAALGCDVRHIPAAHEQPDSVFVEDTAIVLDEVAIVTRPGAASRRGETAAVAETLGAFRQLALLHEPATLDGGDVLRLGRTLYVGVGARTNDHGACELARHAVAFGYAVRTVRVDECLHLKSAVTELAPGLVLLNPAWVDRGVFDEYDAVAVDPGEPFAANVLRIGDTILAAAAYDRTNTRIQAAGLNVSIVDVSELAKAEAGVTCCSLILEGVERPASG
jgi:dimethylargininase